MSPGAQPVAGEFEGQVVVITGAAGLYGGQFARRFAALGARLFLTDRDPNALSALEAELGGPGSVVTCVADLTSGSDLARLCDEVVERLGPPDIVINNAGIYPYGGLLDTPLDTFDDIFAINVRAGFEITRRLAKAMISVNKAGCFLFLGSASAHVLRTNGLAYCASKRAIEWLMKGIALELGPYGIRSNLIEPGFWVGSALTTHDPSYIEATVAQIPLRRLPEVNEAADVAVFLASRAANYITGVSLAVDGGVSIPHRRIA